MKTLKIMFLIAIGLLAIACHNRNDAALSGVYVTAFKNEYTIADDTLIIEAYNLEAKSYNVVRHSGYHRIREGIIQAKEFKQEKWTATFDSDKQVLQEPLGKQLFVNTQAGTISFGATYRKIK